MTMNEKQMELLPMVVERLRALADPLRICILVRLRQGPATITQLVQATAAGQASVSKHVQVLRQVGLVDARRVGTSVICSVADDSIFDICDVLCDGVVRHAKKQTRRLQRTLRASRRVSRR